VILSRSKVAKPKVKYRSIWNDIFGVLATVIVFILPFYFLVVNAAKNEEDSFRLSMAWPKEWLLWQNFKTVITDNDWMVLRSTWNSLVMTLGSVFFLIIIIVIVFRIIR
jgi:raffinose/stachyose/melibiose transport system permease protein